MGKTLSVGLSGNKAYVIAIMLYLIKSYIFIFSLVNVLMILLGAKRTCFWMLS